MVIMSSLEVLEVDLNVTVINSAVLGADSICFSSFLFIFSSYYVDFINDYVVNCYTCISYYKSAKNALVRISIHNVGFTFQ